MRVARTAVKKINQYPARPNTAVAINTLLYSRVQNLVTVKWRSYQCALINVNGMLHDRDGKPGQRAQVKRRVTAVRFWAACHTLRAR